MPRRLLNDASTLHGKKFGMFPVLLVAAVSLA
jgi:hypothetical protein